MPDLTMKSLCETIAESELLHRKDGAALTADEIFNYSPTGELWMIFEWYWQAMLLIEMKRRGKARLVDGVWDMALENGDIPFTNENGTMIARITNDGLKVRFITPEQAAL